MKNVELSTCIKLWKADVHVKIISLAPSNTEILYELGSEEDIIATTSLCDYPEEALEKPSIGGWTNPKIERILELDPDILLASDDLQDEAVEEIESNGYPVIQVKPHTVEEVFESIEKIGKAVDRKEEASELVEDIKESIKGIEFNESPRIYCEEWMDPPMCSGNWIPGLITRAGGEYFIEEGDRSESFKLEELKEFDPEYIFLNVCGAGENLDTAEIKKRDEWKDITAVKQDNILVIDDSLLNRPGPRIVEGLEKIVETVNSEK